MASRSGENPEYHIYNTVDVDHPQAGVFSTAAPDWLRPIKGFEFSNGLIACLVLIGIGTHLDAGNLLLLDEPTNDLDIETLQALEQAILGFAGCAVVISRDRWFLDRIATHILVFEGDSKVVWFEGNWTDYEADFKKRNGIDADNGKPIRYKTLTR